MNEAEPGIARRQNCGDAGVEHLGTALLVAFERSGPDVLP